MLRLSIQHDRKASTKHLDTLINSLHGEMNWQNSHLSRSQAPADPGGKVPKAGLSIQSGRLRPPGLQSPRPRESPRQPSRERDRFSG